MYRGVRNIETNTKGVSVFDWKTFLKQIYKAPSRDLKIWSSHRFQFNKDSESIRYRRFFDSEPRIVKLIKKNYKNKLTNKLEPIKLHKINANRLESLTKLEKYLIKDNIP